MPKASPFYQRLYLKTKIQKDATVQILLYLDVGLQPRWAAVVSGHLKNQKKRKILKIIKVKSIL